MEYECIKAIWQKNDSTRIYAWFSPMISASIGPEGISGLPGAILGLAREDGSVVYFANRFSNEFDAKYIRKEIKSSKSVTKWMFFKQLAVNFSSFEWGRVFLAELERWY
jgi:GLPGLI family protein